MFSNIRKMFSKSVNPLENARGAEKWLEHAAAEGGQVPNLIVELIQRSLEDETVLNFHGLEALQYLDERLQTPIQMLTHQYVSNPRMSRTIQDRIWNDMISFSTVMMSAYRRFIHLSDHPDEALIDKLLPVLTARCLRYLAIQSKWHYFRLGGPNPKLWAKAHQLFRLSEVKGFDSDPLNLYPGNHFVPSTCADEYLQLLLLETVNSGNLLPRQIDQVDQWLNKWTHGLTLERQYHEDKHLYVVNLTEPAGVSRAHDSNVGDMCRYISMQPVLAQITQSVKALERGESPAKLDLGADVRGPGTLELLKLLQGQWSVHRAQQFQRSSERKPVKKSMDVIHGVSTLYTAVKLALDQRLLGENEQETVDYDQLVDMKLYGFVSSRTRDKKQTAMHTMLSQTLVEAESWLIENESEGGLGAVLPAVENDWVRVGALLGFREHGANSWQVGVMRRLIKVNAEQLYSGIQTLHYQPFAVRIEGPDNTRSLNLSISGLPDLSGFTEKNGLIMLAEGQQPSLLLQTAEYASDKLVKLIGREKIITARLRDVREKGVDWTWAQIEVLVTEAVAPN